MTSEFTNPKLETLFSAEQIAARVGEMGEQIARDYAGQELILIGILKGACLFLSDLMRAIDQPLSIEFMAVSSYGKALRSSGEAPADPSREPPEPSVRTTAPALRQRLLWITAENVARFVEGRPQNVVNA